MSDADLLIKEIHDLSQLIRCNKVWNLGTLDDYIDVFKNNNLNLQLEPLIKSTEMISQFNDLIDNINLEILYDIELQILKEIHNTLTKFTLLSTKLQHLDIHIIT